MGALVSALSNMPMQSFNIIYQGYLVLKLMSVTEGLYCRSGRAVAKPDTYAQMLGFASLYPTYDTIIKH